MTWTTAAPRRHNGVPKLACRGYRGTDDRACGRFCPWLAAGGISAFAGLPAPALIVVLTEATLGPHSAASAAARHWCPVTAAFRHALVAQGDLARRGNDFTAR